MPFFTGVGQSLGAAVTDTGTTGGPAGLLRIDPDQLDGAIAVFQEALEALQDEVGRASRDLRARPLAQDEVSIDIANAFNRVGYENADSAVVAWEGAVEQLRSIVQQLEAAKQTIMRTDSGNASIFRVP